MDASPAVAHSTVSLFVVYHARALSEHLYLPTLLITMFRFSLLFILASLLVPHDTLRNTTVHIMTTSLSASSAASPQRPRRVGLAQEPGKEVEVVCARTSLERSRHVGPPPNHLLTHLFPPPPKLYHLTHHVRPSRCCYRFVQGQCHDFTGSHAGGRRRAASSDVELSSLLLLSVASSPLSCARFARVGAAR
jgi:hypothetical protein